MAKAKIVWKRGVFAQIRTMPAVMDELNRRARRIADAAGPGYETRPATVTGGRVRGRTSVKTATTTARRNEARDHKLLRALDAGKD